jgi:hypothetical protein
VTALRLRRIRRINETRVRIPDYRYLAPAFAAGPHDVPTMDHAELAVIALTPAPTEATPAA